MKNIVLIGFQGVGKTFFGKKLADRYQMDFIDTDNLLEKLFHRKYCVREIYKLYGECIFREMEKNVLLNLLHKHNTIISTGGGVVEVTGANFILNQLGRVLYLHEELEVLKKRWDCQGLFLKDKNLEDMYKHRNHLYTKCCSEKVEGKWDQILLADSLQ